MVVFPSFWGLSRKTKTTGFTQEMGSFPRLKPDAARQTTRKAGTHGGGLQGNDTQPEFLLTVTLLVNLVFMTVPVVFLMPLPVGFYLSP